VGDAAGARHEIAREGRQERAFVVVECAVSGGGTEEVEEAAALGVAELFLTVEGLERGEIGGKRFALVFGSGGEQLRRELGETRVHAAAACRQHDGQHEDQREGDNVRGNAAHRVVEHNMAPLLQTARAAPGRKSPSLYELLGVGRNAGDDELKKAYKALARKYHPDLNQNNPQAEGMFKSVTRAYEVLSDPNKRDQYDRALDDEDKQTYTDVASKPSSKRSDAVFFVFVLFLVLAMLFFFVDTAKGTYFLVVAVTLEIRTSIEAIRSELRSRPAR